ncbi:MAG: hypothetical protein DYH07_01685 [Armatimonadetes bacterium ATM1]|nr:hypothetical protein [Armatimonadetes bacterium ATM1]
MQAAVSANFSEDERAEFAHKACVWYADAYLKLADSARAKKGLLSRTPDRELARKAFDALCGDLITAHNSLGSDSWDFIRKFGGRILPALADCISLMKEVGLDGQQMEAERLRGLLT